MEATTGLQILWFIILAVLWTGFLVLEGFDYGVGALLPILGKGKTPEQTDKRRRAMLTTIGPFWDGNEVWLLTAGGATFAAFPQWYATMFSGMYLALLILLVALIIRAMGFEYRHKRAGAEWKRRWDLAIIVGSILPPILIGTALTNLVTGMPLARLKDATGFEAIEFTGNLFTLLNPVSLLGGLVILALCITHGAHFLALKTEGELRTEARAIATKAGLVAAVLAVILLMWIYLMNKGHELAVFALVTTVLAAVALVAGIVANLKGREGWAFVGTTLTIALTAVTYFLYLFPNAINGSMGLDLSLAEASSTPMTLKIMTGAALVFTPIALIYTAYNYWVFRKRISTDHIPDSVSGI